MSGVMAMVLDLLFNPRSHHTRDSKNGTLLVSCLGFMACQPLHVI